MDNFEIIPIKLGNNTSPFTWSESYEILNFCKHYPKRKVGGDTHCKHCMYFKGYIDRSRYQVDVKCSYNYSPHYNFISFIKQLFNFKTK
jgi:hypothetical protein